MERVWEELKRIEAQAEQIRSEAESKAKDITRLADQEAEKLLANGKAYAEEKAKQLFDNTIQEANHSREERLRLNEKATEKLEEQANRRMDQAVQAVLNVILEENKV
jgi:vacuolar-type H+-ATPase subunit H